MSFAIWALLVGVMLISIALSSSSLRRLPISAAMIYLVAGYAIGPAGLGLLTPDPLLYSVVLERVAEVAVLISLFAVGLKLGLPLSDVGWHLPLRLALISMTITVVLIAVTAMWLLELSPGAAILLGAILAPTDPVLASDVQVAAAGDRDRLRFSLTGEGGLNDGAAFPFVMLGLGFLGLHELGNYGWYWLAVDVLWGSAAGLAIGGALGALLGKLVIHLRSRHQESVGLDEFLALGLVAFTYGVAIFAHADGFLAVFAAGLALQRMAVRDMPVTVTNTSTVDAPSAASGTAVAVAASQTSASLMREVRGFNDQMERIAEFALVLIIGAMLAYMRPPSSATLFFVLLFLVLRPVSVWLGLLGATVSREQRILISWFGIRGIGSVFYLMYAINQGLPRTVAEEIIALTLTTVAISIVVHGISVTPLMNAYARRSGRRLNNRRRRQGLDA